MTTDQVYIPYRQELYESLVNGGEMMASMIRQSIFQLGDLPPAEMLAWYVRNATYRFVGKRALHAVGKATDEELEASASEISAIQILLNKNKQLGLLHEVEEILRVAELANG